MAKEVQFTEEQARANREEAARQCAKYNEEHDETKMTFRPLPGGNVQITVERVYTYDMPAPEENPPERP